MSLRPRCKARQEGAETVLLLLLLDLSVVRMLLQFAHGKIRSQPSFTPTTCSPILPLPCKTHIRILVRLTSIFTLKLQCKCHPQLSHLAYPNNFSFFFPYQLFFSLAWFFSHKTFYLDLYISTPKQLALVSSYLFQSLSPAPHPQWLPSMLAPSAGTAATHKLGLLHPHAEKGRPFLPLLIYSLMLEGTLLHTLRKSV